MSISAMKKLQISNENRMLIETVIRESAKFRGHEELIEIFVESIYKKSYLLMDAIRDTARLKRHLMMICDSSIEQVIKEKRKYEYVKEEDIYYEKETGEVLEYNGLIDRLGYKKYQNSDKTKIIRRHIHEEWNEIFNKNRLSDFGKQLYKRRKE